MIDPAWTLPLYLARAAWADLAHDLVLDRMLPPGGAHLVELVGEPLPALRGLDVSRGPAAVLPVLSTVLRRAGDRPAAESLSLLTAAPGDVSAVPAVPDLLAQVVGAGVATLVRDPETGTAVALSSVTAGPDVLRWTVRGIGRCPVAPQPAGIAEASAALGSAVLEAARLVDAATLRTGAGPGTDSRGVDLDREVTPLPPGLPARVLDLLDRADRVEAIVAAATRHRDVGNAAAEREPILRRLRSTVDAARRAAVAATGREALAMGTAAP